MSLEKLAFAAGDGGIRMRRREFMKVAGTTAVAGVVSPTVAAGPAWEDTVSR